jgi:hypothetical protein
MRRPLHASRQRCAPLRTLPDAATCVCDGCSRAQALELRTAVLGPYDPMVEHTLHFTARLLDSAVTPSPQQHTRARARAHTHTHTHTDTSHTHTPPTHTHTTHILCPGFVCGKTIA